MTDTNNRGALAVAQDYVHFIETQDRDGIARLLADDVEQIFPIAADATGEPMGVFAGKDEVLDYTYGLFRKFSGLRWPDPDWSETADGRRAYMEARGSATVTHSGAPYSNVYVTRFDVENGLITRITEYANATLYVSLGIEPTPTEIKAVERVQSRG
ncbi:nuclear transport factor 2 family protein [Sphingomonas sp.]|uniref:nuclear transport factor 2 family protein n=1 Tax=Sphingomonas sp. TaxID=28214 RepID=UPI002BEFA5B7|nr:nuclear transport factor 2 family protein [Sphingomonas sp.]HTG39193.1 nuclear transport factor 2 family protein [Sphingomonas sp.]